MNFIECMWASYMISLTCHNLGKIYSSCLKNTSKTKKYKSKLKWIKFGSYLFQKNYYFLNSKIHLFRFDDLQLLYVLFLIFGQYVISIICFSLNNNHNTKEDSVERNSQKRKVN